MASPLPKHVVSHNVKRADKVREAYDKLYHIERGCKEYEEDHLIGYSRRSPNNNRIDHTIDSLEGVIKLLKEAKEL